MNMEDLKKLDDYRYLIPEDYREGMRVPGLIFSSDKMIESVVRDNAAEQVANVATLPGVLNYSFAMPDIHWGYGFPIGGVAAMDCETGVISPGGVGFDINCGVRMLISDLPYEEVKGRIRDLVDTIFRNVPSGVGSKGKVRISKKELKKVLENGSGWAIENGYGYEEDLEVTEENGCMDEADPSSVSERALERGAPQLGTLGAGNHFLEIQKIEKIFDSSIAKKLGIEEGGVAVMIHTGSRGCGHQICTDYLPEMERASKRYDIKLVDRQLACAPIKSKESKDYYKAMCCAANFAWTNRQLITHWIRESFNTIFGENELKLLYDVCHNIAKFEEHDIEGKRVKCCVHRKGATRAFYDRSEIPNAYREVGQPVLIPGDMGTASYVLVGTKKAIEETFGSTCHGAGRVMSRHKISRIVSYDQVSNELREKGIYLRAMSKRVVCEEAPQAYKRVDDVVETCDKAGISKTIAKMVPMGVVKG
jgi:tRNA-splicing ligase RtcB